MAVDISGARNVRLARLDQLLKERILILDGAMGTMIQRYALTEKDYRGERFADWASDLRAQRPADPHPAEDHRDIHVVPISTPVRTSSRPILNSQSISMADYRMEELVYELSREGAARAAADE